MDFWPWREGICCVYSIHYVSYAVLEGVKECANVGIDVLRDTSQATVAMRVYRPRFVVGRVSEARLRASVALFLSVVKMLRILDGVVEIRIAKVRDGSLCTYIVGKVTCSHGRSFSMLYKARDVTSSGIG
jgi:hypothetical protein